jgi:hypothetical protein
LVLVFGTTSQQLLITFRFHGQGMHLMLKYIFCALTAIVALATTECSAVSVTSIRQFNLLHNNTNSPFFATSVDAVNTFVPATYPTDPSVSESVVFTPDGAPRAGEVATITTRGVFNIVGSSTSAGGWTDGNGVPAGITLAFNAKIVFSVNPASPPNSRLTLVGIGNNRGNGLGITQTTWNGTTGGSSTIGNAHQNEDVSADDVLDVSAVDVTGISFTGTLAESGYSFAPGSVGNFGPNVIRSGNNTASGLIESAETFGLISATGPAPQPGDEGLPTIGFGRPIIQSEIDLRRGEGIVASHVASENDFTGNNVDGDPVRFPRQIGAWTLRPQNGTMGVKGVGYQYDVTFDITSANPNIPGDYNHNGVVDAADYVVWRKGDLVADSNGDTLVNQTDYDFWRARFGNGAPGAGAGLTGSAVPEPAALTLLVIGLLATCSGRRAKLAHMRTI